MSRTFKVVGVILIVAVGAYGAYYMYQRHRMQKAGILSENIVHNGDEWQADFVARVPAPEKSVFDAIKNVENTHSDEIKDVKVLSQNGNEKTVEMEIEGPGGQTITTRLAFQYFPDEGRIAYHTIGGNGFDTQAEYRLGDEGPSTLMKYHESV